MRRKSIKLYLPLSFEQVVQLVRQLSGNEKQKLISILENDKGEYDNDPVMTHFASQNVLAKGWLSPQEDQAWQDL